MMLADFGEIVVGGSLIIDRGIGTGIVMGRGPEFFWGILAQVMMEGEEKDAHMRGVPKHLVTMFRHGIEMSYNLALHIFNFI